MEQIDIKKMAEFIQSKRKEQQLTQKELGEQLGVTDKAISKWERGLSFPDITLLPSIAKVFSCTVTELISGEVNDEEKIDETAVNEVFETAIEYSIKQSGQKRGLFLFKILCIIAAVSSIICLTINIAVNHTIDWALYPMGAMAVIILPFYAALISTKHKFDIVVGTLFLSISGYLLLIQALAPTKGWFLPVALPIVLVNFISFYCIVKAIKYIVALKKNGNSSLSINIYRLICAFFAFVSLLCIIINIAVNHSINWSLYPIGAFLVILLPYAAVLFCKSHKVDFTFLVMFLSVSGYLLLIQTLAPYKGWFLPLALPITAFSFVIAYLVAKAFVHFRNIFFSFSILSLAVIVESLLIDIILNFNNIEGEMSYNIVIPSCLAVSVILLTIGIIINAVKKSKGNNLQK